MVSKNALFKFFSIFFLIGVFVNNISKNINISFLVLLVIVVLFLGYYFFSKKFKSILFISFIGCLLGIFLSLYQIEKLSSLESKILIFVDNKPHEITFELGNVNKVTDFNKEYSATLLKIDNYKFRVNVGFNIIVEKNAILSKGDVIKTKSKVYLFENSSDFNYKYYMYSKNLFFKTYVNDYDIIVTSHLYKIEDFLIKLRENFLKTIYYIYPKEEAIYLGGILLGARDSLPEDLKNDFNNSGLTHIIAVSGFNITIIIVFIGFILKYFPTYVKNIIITISIIVFSFLVGFGAPVIRAAIMGIVGYYIINSGRRGDSLAIILFSALLMVIYSPLSLNYDVSLHLSFLAVLGIIYTQKYFDKMFFFLPNILEIKTAFVLTISALSFTLPILLLNFGYLSILSPFANIAVSWTIPIAMLLGFLSIIVYLVQPFLGIIVGYLAWIFLKWCIIVVHFFGKLDFAILRVDFGIYKYFVELLYFMVLIFLILWYKENVVKKVV